MADHLHPAIDIPGAGLWEGARIRHRNGWSGVVLEDCRGQEHVGAVLDDGEGDTWLDEPAVARLSLRLDDPLGLGLAGLAGRVAERIDAEPRETLHTLVMDLAHRPWALPSWRDAWLADRLAELDRVIREAATLLARLDRLVAATWPEDGIVLAPGTVPDWRRDGAEWVLTVGPVGCARYAVDVLDPIEAAGTVLEVTDAGR